VSTFSGTISSPLMPTSLFLSPEGDLMVVNMYSQTLMTFTSDGVPKNSTNISLQDSTVLQAVMGSNSHIYALTAANRNLSKYVVRLSLDGSVISILYNANDVGTIAVTRDGLLYVTNTSDNSITIFDADGKQLRKIFSDTNPAVGFTRPDVLHIDNSSALYVLDQKYAMVYHLSSNFELLWSFNCTEYISSPFALTADHRGDVYLASFDGGHFIHIRHSSDDSVLQYVFTEHVVSGWMLQVDKQSMVYMLDADRRVLVLTPTDPFSDSSELTMIICLSVAAMAAVLAGSMATYRLAYIKQHSRVHVQSEYKSQSEDKLEQSITHASRRDRRRRRCSDINFLSHYHDNHRVPPTEEDNGDYVLYI
jgi:outer membrane protein assembly factor BamB